MHCTRRRCSRARRCSTGPEWLCAISAERTRHRVASDNVPTGDAASGSSTLDSLLNAGDVDAQSTAARSARRAPGARTGFGAWRPRKAKAHAMPVPTPRITTIITITIIIIITARGDLKAKRRRSRGRTSTLPCATASIGSRAPHAGHVDLVRSRTAGLDILHISNQHGGNGKRKGNFVLLVCIADAGPFMSHLCPGDDHCGAGARKSFTRYQTSRSRRCDEYLFC